MAMTNEKIIQELEIFKNKVKIYFKLTDSLITTEERVKAREYINRNSQKIKRYLKEVQIPIDISGRAAPVAGGFPFSCNLIEDIFSNEGTPYAIKPQLVLDAINKAIGVYESQEQFFGASKESLREGFFLDGQFYDAQKFILDLIKKAQTTIDIIDNFIDENVIELLSAKAIGVSVKIITKNTPAHLKSIAKAFAKQHGVLEIRESNSFHDRFIIIDGNSFYHLGASIKDLGKSTFMFSVMEEKALQIELRKKWQTEWNKATVII